MNADSKYSDQNISILAGLRYCGLPTRVTRAYQTATNTNSRVQASDRKCGCGIFEQTTWHLLMVSANCAHHSPDLRSVSKARYAKGLAWLADLLGGTNSGWRIV